jgi:hypothetical protein
MQHTANGEALVFEDVETLVLAEGHQSSTALEDELAEWTGEYHVIGDAAAPRTAEEAVLEGLKIASRI